jgi:arylsulfatase A-like enzyme
VVAEPVSLRDLAVTVVAALGPAVAGNSPFPGRSLVADPPGGPVLSELAAPPEADPNHGDSPICRGPLRSVVAGGFHYIRRGDDKEELYELERDPGERHDLARSEDAVETLSSLRLILRPDPARIAQKY